MSVISILVLITRQLSSLAVRCALLPCYLCRLIGPDDVRTPIGSHRRR
ncbi:MAG: hypothetical protein KBF97_03465 [Bacteroidetes bacterium]|nr:hypothetical protein [Bacteroidota bacterium]